MEDVFRWSPEPIWEWDKILLITPKGSHIPLAIKLNFEATNNMAEYETCITEMEALQELGVKEAKVFRDLALVIAHV